MKLLFVCSGNTCRSPMAKVIFRKLLADKKDYYITVDSAGLFTSEGLPASGAAIKAMHNMGLDLSSHTSQVICESLIIDADLVLTMTREQKFCLEEQFPDKGHKVFTLGEFVGEPHRDILDPYGKSQEMYQQSSREIKEILIKVLKILLNKK